MDIRPLTKEQQRFAEENHHLVYAFLNQKELPESLFYDIVIFGYNNKRIKSKLKGLSPVQYRIQSSLVA